MLQTTCLHPLTDQKRDAIIAHIDAERGGLQHSAWAKQVGVSVNLVQCALVERQREALFTLVVELVEKGIMSANKALTGREVHVLERKGSPSSGTGTSRDGDVFGLHIRTIW